MSTAAASALRTLRAVPPLAYPLAAAVIVTSLDGAGFTPRSQTILIVLTALTLLAAALLDPASIAAAARAPVVLVLVALGAISVASAVWTVGGSTDAARSGLVVLSYAALAAAGTMLAGRVGAWPIAVGVAVLAAIEAVLGLRAAALHVLPDAEWIAGSWRPGGSLQYPPALGLLEVAALPALLSGLSRRGAGAVLALIGAVLAGATLGSADSRMDIALGAVVLATAAVWPPARYSRRLHVLAAAALIVAAGLAGHFVLGRHVAASARGGDPPRPDLVAAVRVPVAFVQPSDLTHGRTHEWKAAIETWFDRPLLGAGAASYYQASARHQGSSPVRFAHNLPLELAAELGILGVALAIGLYVASFDALRRGLATPAAWLLGPTVVAFLLANLVDWSWHLAALSAVWAVAAGGVVAAGRART